MESAKTANISLEQYMKDANVEDALLNEDFDINMDDDELDIDALFEAGKNYASELENMPVTDYFDDTDDAAANTETAEVTELPPKAPTPTPCVINGDPQFSPTPSVDDGTDQTEPMQDNDARSITSATSSTKREIVSQAWRLQNQLQSEMPVLAYKGSVEARTELAEIMKDPRKKLIDNRIKHSLKNYRFDSSGGQKMPRPTEPPALRLLRESNAKMQRQAPYARPPNNRYHHRVHPHAMNGMHRFDLREKLPMRPMHPMLPMSPFQNQVNDMLQIIPLMQSAPIVEAINKSFKPKYDMEIQRKIAEIQGRVFRYICNPLAPLTQDGDGLDAMEFTPKGAKATLNMRFS